MFLTLVTSCNGTKPNSPKPNNEQEHLEKNETDNRNANSNKNDEPSTTPTPSPYVPNACGTINPAQVYMNFVQNVPYEALEGLFSSPNEIDQLSVTNNLPLVCDIQPRPDLNLQTAEGFSYTNIPLPYEKGILYGISTNRVSPKSEFEKYRSIAYTNISFWRDFATLHDFFQLQVGIYPMNNSANTQTGRHLGGLYLPDSKLVVVRPLFGHSYLRHEMAHVFQHQNTLKRNDLNGNARPQGMNDICSKNLQQAIQEFEAMYLESQTFPDWYYDLSNVISKLTLARGRFEMNKVSYLSEFARHIEDTARIVSNPKGGCSEKLVSVSNNFSKNLSQFIRNSAESLRDLLLPLLKDLNQYDRESCEKEPSRPTCIKLKLLIDQQIMNAQNFKLSKIGGQLFSIPSEIEKDLVSFLKELTKEEKLFVCSTFATPELKDVKSFCVKD
jgi:hypothetical protein